MAQNGQMRQLKLLATTEQRSVGMAALAQRSLRVILLTCTESDADCGCVLPLTGPRAAVDRSAAAAFEYDIFLLEFSVHPPRQVQLRVLERIASASSLPCTH